MLFGLCGIINLFTKKENTMKAILNYFDNPKIKDAKYVGVGDTVVAQDDTEIYDLTPNKKYEIIEVNSVTMITIINDNGVKEVYPVVYFR